MISDIQGMKDRGVFREYIDYIRFPFYRNLEQNTKITFDFPFTVFVGQNGCGKSSTLQALYGAPDGKSVGNYWFSTKMDPIEDGGERPAFIYSYKDRSGVTGEVLKTRIKKDMNPDYWEPSRPLRKYGMDLRNGARFPAIKMNVIYIDFRAILSAFDKYFYYHDPINLQSKTKQDYLRNKSILLKKAIDENSIKMTGSKSQNKLPINLSDTELTYMSIILNKKYEKGTLIEHKFFKDWGYSILFSTPLSEYSEAFAGSGETAVAILVHEMLKAQNNSLILLDEPEMSLHPGAQKRLKQFIFQQIKQKHHQVVISTHSPSLIEGLPSKAIKVFTQLPNGKFNVGDERLPEEAFYYIGQTLSSKKKIIVEDQLARDIIQNVIDAIGVDCASLFYIEFHPGGHTIIKSDFIKVYSQDVGDKVFVILDGDQKIVQNHFDIGDIPVSLYREEQQDQLLKCLKEKVQEQVGFDIEFHPDGNSSGGNKEQLIKLMESYLQYYFEKVHYLPLTTPESIIWDDAYATRSLEAHFNGESAEHIISQIDETSDFKEKFRIYSEIVYGCGDTQSAKKKFLKYWIGKKDDNFNQIKDIILHIKNTYQS